MQQIYKAILLVFIITITQQLQNDPPASILTVPLQVSASIGSWKGINGSRELDFPRFFICGAQLNNFTMAVPYNCSIKKDNSTPAMLNCEGGQIMWDRSNGIKFKFCHFENWDDQTSDQFYGSYEWQSIKMCPKDHYVYNMSVKVNENEGLTGLTLNCLHKDPLIKTKSDVIVKDGKGVWQSIYSNNSNYFAAFYEIKTMDDQTGIFITGLGLHFRPFPLISNLSIEYIHSTPYDFTMQKLNSQSFDNTKTNSSINIAFDSSAVRNTKLFEYSLSNWRTKYHTFKFKQFLLNKLQLKMKLPNILSKPEFTDIQIDKKVGCRFQNILLDDFQFGKKFYRKFQNYSASNYTVPACTRLMLDERYYYAMVDIPYILNITYSSLDQNYTQILRGTFSGKIYSKPQIMSTHINLC